MARQKVIYFADMLKALNIAMQRHELVSFKAWKVGKGPLDPEHGTVRTYDRVYVSSHSRTGTYRVLDPLSEDHEQRYRRVCEALIFEFMGRRVIW